MLPDSLVGIEEDSRSAGAPVNEIEITSGMIGAGVVALLNSEWRYDECDA